MRIKELICVCLSLVISAQVFAQSKNAPCARSGYAMAYDERRGTVVLFGGQDSTSTRLGDTWEWKNGNWKQINIPGPAARINATIGYDAVGKTITLFGGSAAGGAQNDLWVYNGKAWSKINTSTAPPARQLANMCFDKSEGQFVLFGGIDVKKNRLGDTWMLKNNQWVQLIIAGPAARASHCMVYDAGEQCVYLYGGYIDDGLKDFWQLKNGAWHEITNSTGPVRLHTSIVYDRDKKRLLMFGGFNENERTNELWEYANNKWKIIAALNDKIPAPRAEHRGVFIPKKGFFVFGGVVGPDANTRNRGNDTWIYRKDGWVRMD